MNQTKIILAAMLLTFMGCMKVSKKNAEKPQQITQQQQPEQPTNEPLVFTQEILPTTKFDFEVTAEDVQFQIPVSWPEQLYVEILDQNQTTMIPVILAETANKVWTFKWNSLKHKVTFNFRSDINKNVKPLKTLDVLPPLNIETTEDIDLASNYQLNKNVEKIYFDNLTLIKGAHLYLGEYSGKIVIRNLSSDAGFIQSFATNQKAPLGADGRSGGHVDFEIQNAEGFLTLMAIGENGGDGSPGRSADEALRGRQGEDGGRSEFVEAPPCVGIHCGFYFTVYQCTKNPTDGFPGYPGLKGYAGYPGRQGGNSGFYTAKSTPQNLTVNVVTKEGRKGQGGAGGNGGPGGFGGEGGDGATMDLFMTRFKYSKEKALAEKGKNLLLAAINPTCPAARKGNDGPQGPQGDRGLDGLDGINEGLKN